MIHFSNRSLLSNVANNLRFTPSVQPSQSPSIEPDIVLSLSFESTALSELLQGRSSDPDRRAVSIASLERQLNGQSDEADLLDMIMTLPDTEDPSRLALARQAANFYALQSGREQVFDDAESHYPFAELDRRTLSRMAYDPESVATPIERILAAQDIADRDDRYTRAMLELAGNLEGEVDDRGQPVPWQLILKEFERGVLSSGMTELERRAKGLGEPQLYFDSAQANSARHGVESPVLPDYLNLSGPPGSLLAIATDTEGNLTWRTASISTWLGPDTALALVDSIRENKSSEPGRAGERWVSMYMRIDALGGDT